MAVNFSFKFTEVAENDLNSILQYISEDLSNISAAQNLYQKIFQSIDNIRSFPDSGLFVKNEYLQDKTIRRVLVENYTIYYKTDDDNKTIYIIRIVYSRQNFNEVVKTL